MNFFFKKSQQFLDLWNEYLYQGNRELGVVPQAYEPSAFEVEQEDQKYKTILSSVAGSRPT